MVCCAVVGCPNTSRNTTAISFFNFPRDEERRKAWARFCGRAGSGFGLKFVNSVNDVLSTRLRVCSEHFRPHEIQRTITGLKVVKKGVIPSLKRTKSTSRDIRAERRCVNDENIPPNHHEMLVTAGDKQQDDRATPSADPSNSDKVEHDHSYAIPSDSKGMRTVSSQTDITLLDMDDLVSKENSGTTCNCKPSSGGRQDKFTKSMVRDDSSVTYYTGLPSLSVLLHIFSLLEPLCSKLSLWGNTSKTTTKPSKPGPSRKLTTYEEFLLTLLRLRQGVGVRFASDLFGISESLAGNIFRTWISLMSNNLGPLLIKWPSREQLQLNIPQSFMKYKNTTVIIDGTEFHIQRPSCPTTQRSSWSDYKSSNTMKSLVGITPSGLFSFVSQLWAGSISDRKLTQVSGILDKLQDGDEVMADRGFNIRDLLTNINVKLNMPPLVNTNKGEDYIHIYIYIYINIP